MTVANGDPVVENDRPPRSGNEKDRDESVEMVGKSVRILTASGHRSDDVHTAPLRGRLSSPIFVGDVDSVTVDVSHRSRPQPPMLHDRWLKNALCLPRAIQIVAPT